MNKQTRTYEEIITLQDKAIEALTQANAALVMALEALKKARAEHGFPIQLPGLGSAGSAGNGIIGTVPNPAYGPFYVPNTTDGIQWQSTGIATLTNTNMADSQMATKTTTAQSLIAQAQSQKEMAQAYISAFQSQKESDAGQVGGCISVS